MMATVLRDRFESRKAVVSNCIWIWSEAAVHVCEFSKKGRQMQCFECIPSSSNQITTWQTKSSTNVPFISTSIEENWLNLLQKQVFARYRYEGHYSSACRRSTGGGHDVG
jgi:hypothetical protein